MKVPLWIAISACVLSFLLGIGCSILGVLVATRAVGPSAALSNHPFWTEKVNVDDVLDELASMRRGMFAAVYRDGTVMVHDHDAPTIRARHEAVAYPDCIAIDSMRYHTQPSRQRLANDLLHAMNEADYRGYTRRAR